jgi:curved DNA-binding protein CbpA
VSRARLLELLGLQGSATRDEIKSRYHELARRFHPDVDANDERSHARFRAIVAAYHELLSGEPDEGSLRERAACAPPAVEAERSDDLDVESRAPATSRNPDGGLARRYAEARSRSDQCRRMVRRVQADVRDGDAKALAARQRGNDRTARHFERRAEADRSRLYALLGEIAELELELHGLEAGLAGGSGETRTTRISSEPRSDPGVPLKREVQKVHDEERAVLKKKYENDGRQR